jgi:hypothetical protein
MKRQLWLSVLLLAASLPASAEMTAEQKQVHIMAIDPAPAGTEYAISMETRQERIVIIIPPDTATGVSDVLERDLISDYVRLNFVFTGRMRVLFPPRWFEFMDVNTKKRYRFFEKDKTTITGLFVDGSTVQFAFYGTAIECPSGQCFTWVVGSETKAIIKPPRRKQNRTGHDHPGKERRNHYVHTGSSPLPGQPYDPYDLNNWAGPAPDHNSRPIVNAAPVVAPAPKVVAPAAPVVAPAAPRTGGGGRR